MLVLVEGGSDAGAARALAVQRVIASQGELASFRRFQAMPQHRGTPVHRQLHRFLGTRATRKIRTARRLVDALGLERLPRPLAQLAARLQPGRSGCDDSQDAAAVT